MSSIFDTLSFYWGYTDFLPHQEEVINELLNNEDVFLLKATGGGKSLAYQLPPVHTKSLGIVISPLISLMKDQVDDLNQKGIRAVTINSQTPYPEKRAIEQELKEGKVRLLYISPERVRMPEFLAYLKTLSPSIIAIDEAHCISKWGHDFRPEYRMLSTIKDMFPDIPLIAVTATATEEVRRDIIRELRLHNPHIHIGSFNRENLYYEVRESVNVKGEILEYLGKHPNESGIIYCFSRQNTEDLAAFLRERGHIALPYHAKLSDEMRRRTQDKFVRDEIPIVCATVAFGMGIDKPDIRFVIHYELPKDIESYYQETGRAGRDNLPSDCILFYNPADKGKQFRLIGTDEGDPQQKKIRRQKLLALTDFCESPICRRTTLLNYFGETFEARNCEKCDNCLNPKRMIDGSEYARAILSCVKEVNGRVGKVKISKILRSSGSQDIAFLHPERLESYGTCRAVDEKLLKNWIGELTQQGYLRTSIDGLPVLSLTEKGRQFLESGEGDIFLSEPATPQARPVSSKTESDYYDYDEELFEKLRAERNEIAKNMNLPPYTVFLDVSLIDMARYYPITKSEFIGLRGVGEAKWEKFGETFVEIIKTVIMNSSDVPDSASLREEKRTDEPSENIGAISSFSTENTRNIKQILPNGRDENLTRSSDNSFHEHAGPATTSPEDSAEHIQEEEHGEEYQLQNPQKSSNILEHIYLLNREREELEDKIRKIDADVKYLYETTYNQGVSEMGKYKLQREERSTRSLNVEKFKASYPDIFNRCKRVTASAMEKAIGKDNFQIEMQERHPEEFSAVAKVTISDIRKEVPDELITEFSDIKKSVSYEIQVNNR